MGSAAVVTLKEGTLGPTPGVRLVSACVFRLIVTTHSGIVTTLRVGLVNNAHGTTVPIPTHGASTQRLSNRLVSSARKSLRVSQTMWM